MPARPSPRAPLAAALIALAAAGAAARPAAAQPGVLSTPPGVAITAAKATALSVTVVSGATQTIPSITDGAVNFFPSPVTITTTWDLAPMLGQVHLVAYFANPAQALAAGASYIPSSRIRGRVPTGTPTTFTAFTQNATGAAGSAGGSLRLWSRTVLLIFGLRGTRTDNLELQLDLTGQPALTPGLYAGTLNLRAVTQ